MPLAINLLKNRHTLSEAEYQKEQTYYRYTITASILVAVITLAVSIWHFVLTRHVNTLEKSISASTQQLAGLAEANAKHIYLKSRLTMITKFLENRSVARQSLQKVFSTSIPGVSISGVNFESDTLLNVQVTADSVLSLNSYIDFLETDSDFFLQIVSKNITRREKGDYQMDVVLTIPKG